MLERLYCSMFEGDDDAIERGIVKWAFWSLASAMIFSLEGWLLVLGGSDRTMTVVMCLVGQLCLSPLIMAAVLPAQLRPSWTRPFITWGAPLAFVTGVIIALVILLAMAEEPNFQLIRAGRFRE